jgi:hypothetical protein
VQGDITQLPIRTEGFDALISLDVIAHLPDGFEGYLGEQETTSERGDPSDVKSAGQWPPPERFWHSA